MNIVIRIETTSWIEGRISVLGVCDYLLYENVPLSYLGNIESELDWHGAGGGLLEFLFCSTGFANRRMNIRFAILRLFNSILVKSEGWGGDN